MASRSLTSLLTLSIALYALPALAQPKAAPPAQDTLKENFLAEHEIGRRFSLDPAQLPAPKSSPIVTNRSLTLPSEGHVPQVPAGFTVTLFASGLANPRRLLVLPNGDVLVAEQSAGYLTLLRDEGDGKACVEWGDRLSKRKSDKAVKVFERACTFSMPDGCHRAALLLGGDPKAAELEEKACKLGRKPSCKSEEVAETSTTAG